MTLLIDADWLIYTACAACETDIRWDEWINTLHLEQADVKDFISSKVGYWQDLTGHSDVVMCLSDYPTFRHSIFFTFTHFACSCRNGNPEALIAS